MLVKMLADGELEQRDRFVQAALSYVGTPYHHLGYVKGPQGGVDCATFLLCAAIDAGLSEKTELEYYSPDWHLHQTEERYIAKLKHWCVEVDWPALPGDIAVWKFDNTFSHGAIVVEWPTIVHAVRTLPVNTDDADRAMWLRFEHYGKPRPVKLFSFWPR